MTGIASLGLTEQRTRRAARTRTIGVRVTEPEYLALEGEAWRAGKTVADWARNQILSRSPAANGASLQERTLTELVGIELLLINALPPLLRGERIPQERVEALWKQVQTTKGRKAQELLGKQPNSEEKH
jgi:Mobilization protein NikA